MKIHILFSDAYCIIMFVCISIPTDSALLYFSQDRHRLFKHLLSDISIENIGSKYTITGNLNNVGIKDVKNVVISILISDNIEPLQPNVRYFIGSLEADDFGSFELSAQVNSLNKSSIPVQIEYRNIDNAYTHVTESIDLESSIPDQNSQVLSNNTTILPIAVIVALLLCVGIVGIIRNSWKKRENI